MGQKTVLLSSLLLLACCAVAQKSDSTRRIINFRGAVSVTNNGFSLVPTFTLGKPALVAIFGVSGQKRLSFEPEFRYSLEDFKPWSFIFIWRYKLVRKEKFQFSLGTHLPALNFITPRAVIDSMEENIIKARRFFPVFEAIPNYRFGNNFTLGMYAQYGKGLEKEVANDIYLSRLQRHPAFEKTPAPVQSPVLLPAHCKKRRVLRGRQPGAGMARLPVVYFDHDEQGLENRHRGKGF